MLCSVQFDCHAGIRAKKSPPPSVRRHQRELEVPRLIESDQPFYTGSKGRLRIGNSAGESCRIDAGIALRVQCFWSAFSILFIPTNPFAIIDSGRHTVDRYEILIQYLPSRPSWQRNKRILSRFVDWPIDWPLCYHAKITHKPKQPAHCRLAMGNTRNRKPERTRNSLRCARRQQGYLRGLTLELQISAVKCH